MKNYKSTYCVSLLYYAAMMFICCGPLLILVDVVSAVEGQITPGEIFWGAVLVFCLYGAACVLFVLLISFLIGLFSRKTVQLSENAISYAGKTIPLDKIRYVTLYLPVISRFSSKPQYLTVWADNKNYMDIKRPSIALIAALKKRCVFASFDVDDRKSHLKQCLWIQLGIIAFGVIAYIFGIQ